MKKHRYDSPSRRASKGTAAAAKQATDEELSKLKTQIGNLEDALKSRDANVSKLERDLATVTDDKEGLVRMLSDANSRVGELEARLEAMRGQDGGLREHLADLKVSEYVAWLLFILKLLC